MVAYLGSPRVHVYIGATAQEIYKVLSSYGTRIPFTKDLSLIYL